MDDKAINLGSLEISISQHPTLLPLQAIDRGSLLIRRRQDT